MFKPLYALQDALKNLHPTPEGGQRRQGTRETKT